MMDVWVFDEKSGAAFRWNGSRTINVFGFYSHVANGAPQVSREIDVFEFTNEPHTIEQLVDHCEAYVKGSST